MKRKLITLFWLSILATGYFLVSFSPQVSAKQNNQPFPLLTAHSSLKDKAFLILKTKCNVCHRRRNPFMIFSKRNMNRRASRIYKQVFIKRRMPKGDKIKLTPQEYNILRDWLKTQNIK